MLFRNILWYALIDAKYWDIYVSLYIDRCRKREKWTNIVLLVFSSSGVLGWKFWNAYPVFVCLALGIWQLLDLIRPGLLTSHEDYNKLADIRHQSSQICTDLEYLWIRLHDNHEEATALQKVFFEQCRPAMNRVQSISDSLIIPCKIKSINKAATAEISKYLNRYETKATEGQGYGAGSSDHANPTTAS